MHTVVKYNCDYILLSWTVMVISTSSWQCRHNQHLVEANFSGWILAVVVNMNLSVSE